MAIAAGVTGPMLRASGVNYDIRKTDKYGVYLADKGITGRSVIIVNKDGKVAWVKHYDIPVVPDVAEVAAALQSVKSASA